MLHGEFAYTVAERPGATAGELEGGAGSLGGGATETRARVLRLAADVALQQAATEEETRPGVKTG